MTDEIKISDDGITDTRRAYELKVQDLARETARLGKLIDAMKAAGHCDDGLGHSRWCGECRALREVSRG